MNNEFSFPLGIEGRLSNCLAIRSVIEHYWSVLIVAGEQIERHFHLRRTHWCYAQRSVQYIEVVVGRKAAQVVIALDSRHTCRD